MISTTASRPISEILVAVARADRLFVYLLEHLRRPPVAAMSAHALYLKTLDEALVCHGPLRGGDGGVVCVHADDESAAEAIALADPLVVFGFTLYQLRELDRIDRLSELAPAFELQ